MQIPNVPYKRCYDCVVHQLINQRAYEIFEWRRDNNEDGDDKSDWFLAEEEIVNKLAELAVEKVSKKLKENL